SRPGDLRASRSFPTRRSSDLSWWVNLHGHAEPRIAEAIGRQARSLEQVILAGCSHPPAVELAERLLALAPREPGRAPLAKVFYRSEEHTSELQSRENLVCRLL